MSADSPVPGGPPPQGTWSINESQIAEIARKEVCDLAGVVGTSETGLMDRISGHAGGVRASIKSGQVQLSLSIVVEYGKVLPCLSDQIRERAARAVESMTGYRVASVDVTIADLHVPGDPLPTREPGISDAPAGGGRIDF